MKTLAERLRWAREKKELSQQVLAQLAGLSQPAIAALENSTRKSSRSIATLAAVLDVDTDWLATGRGAPDRNPSAPRIVRAQITKLSESSETRRNKVYVDDALLAIIRTYEEVADDQAKHFLIEAAKQVRQAKKAALLAIDRIDD